MSFNALFGLGSHSIPSTLKLDLPLQETTGTTAVDRSGNSFNGTIYGMGSNPVTASGPNGWLASAYDLDGSNDYVDIANPFGSIVTTDGGLTAEFAISLWMKPDVTGSLQEIMMCTDAPGDYTYLVELRFQSTAKIDWYLRQGGNGVGYGTTVLSAGTWYHVLLRQQNTSGQTSIIIDATEQGIITGNNFGTRFPTGPLRLGAFTTSSPTYLFNGKVAGLSVHGVGVSDSDNTEIRNGPEPECTSVPTLTIDATSFSGSVGSWSLPSPYAGGSNGTLTYAWELRDADDDSVIASGSTSTISGTGSYSGDYYLWVRASNDGGYDSAEDSVSADETAGGGGTDTLTATGIATGAPSVGSPTLGQAHALTATGVSTGSPSVDSPAIAQVHALTATGVATVAPSVGSPTLGQVHSLTAIGVATAAPSVGSPALGQVHALTVTGVATGSPSVGSPSLDSSSAVDDLTANGVSTGDPSVGSPAIGQLHALVASAIASGAPSVGSPLLGQVHVLSASDVATDSPSVGSPWLDRTTTFRPYWAANSNIFVGL